MVLSRALLYISTIIWLFPPLRQFRGGFFYYFLFLAVSDPIVLIQFTFKLPSLPLYVVMDFLTLISLWKPDILTKRMAYLILPIIILYFAAYKVHYTYVCGFLIFLHIILFYFVLRFFSFDIMETKKVKLYYLAILLYELTIMLKYAFVLANVKTGLRFYYSTTTFEILLAMFFILINEHNKRLAIPIKVNYQINNRMKL